MDTDPAYIVEVCDPYRGHDQETPCLTAEGVGKLVEEVTGVSAATITADLLADGEYSDTVGETGIEVSVRALAGAVA
jgi:hypothetical protein